MSFSVIKFLLLGVTALLLLGCADSKFESVDSFENLVEHNEIVGKKEEVVIQIFGKPDRIRNSESYYVFAYDVPVSNSLYETECLIRFNRKTKSVTHWQINSD